MRQYINIVESAGFAVPKMKAFVTDELVNEIITSGLWTTHGSSLSDEWLPDMMYSEKEHFPFNLSHQDTPRESWEKLKAEPNFRRWFKNYLVLRANYIQECFAGKHGHNALTGDTTLFRAIRVNKRWLGEIKQPSKGRLPLGIYWGVGEVSTWGYVEDDAPNLIVMSAKLRDVRVDWYETFRSRLDYDHGDREQEIQLEKGSVIENVIIDEAHPDRKFIA